MNEPLLPADRERSLNGEEKMFLKNMKIYIAQNPNAFDSEYTEYKRIIDKVEKSEVTLLTSTDENTEENRKRLIKKINDKIVFPDRFGSDSGNASYSSEGAVFSMLSYLVFGCGKEVLNILEHGIERVKYNRVRAIGRDLGSIVINAITLGMCAFGIGAAAFAGGTAALVGIPVMALLAIIPVVSMAVSLLHLVYAVASAPFHSSSTSNEGPSLLLQEKTVLDGLQQQPRQQGQEGSSEARPPIQSTSLSPPTNEEKRASLKDTGNDRAPDWEERPGNAEKHDDGQGNDPLSL